MKQNMLKQTFFALVCLFSLQAKAQKTLQPAELKADFVVFKSILQQAHPGLYRYTSKEHIDAHFKAIEAQLSKPMDETAFYQLLMPLIAQIKCGHTKFFPKGKPSDKFPYYIDQLFPLHLHFKDKETVIVGGFRENEPNVPVGAKVIAIDGYKMDALREKLMGFIVADGDAIGSKQLELTYFFPGYLAAFHHHKAQYEVTYQLPGKTPQKAVFPAVDLGTIGAYGQKYAQKKEPYTFKMLNEHTALLSMNTFSFGNSEQYEDFLSKTFTQLKNKQVKNLVIDLRYNEGGTDKFGGMLFSYLINKPTKYYTKIETNVNKRLESTQPVYVPAQFDEYVKLLQPGENGKFLWRNEYVDTVQPKANHFEGNVYLLTNGWSFSVTTEFIAATRYNNLARIVGEEAGSQYQGNNSGFFAILQLPNSDFELGIPMWSYYMATDGKQEDRKAMQPDMLLEPSTSDILFKTDTQLARLMDIIAKNAPHSTLSKAK
ncbi:peptidase S41-like protein [Chitinophaga skermanii]|uniref:Peptidase S41-like protein n=1 Tax=Chitinophaga skermanii TaxID=331697 RepID=A0A327Q7Y3_9BACT|nr:S41 family peptidase [Chitinophaga skermanii]RAI99811.1 peptidase S41-like protein [Chitinophaga skermanii]